MDAVSPLRPPEPCCAVRTAPVVLVIERQAYWGPECARQLVGIATVETCAPDDGWSQQFAGEAPKVIVLDAGGLRLSAHAVSRLCESTAAVVVIVSAGGESMEWWLRELGVSAVYRDDHARDEVLATCRRLLRA